MEHRRSRVNERDAQGGRRPAIGSNTRGLPKQALTWGARSGHLRGANSRRSSSLVPLVVRPAMSILRRSVYEFTPRIETPPGITSEEARASVDELLQASSDVIGAEAALDPETGVIASTFHVEADTVDAAEETGIRVVSESLDERA